MNLNFLNSGKSKIKNHWTGGFTLLEVMIAIFILTFISFGIYQATVAAFKLRDSLQSEGDFHNSIRFSMSILGRDIAMLYSPTALIRKKNPSTIDPSDPYGTNQQLIQVDDLGRSYKFWLPASEKNGIRLSHFIGESNKLSFVTLSHTRIYKDKPESDFAKITYEVKRDEKNEANRDALVLIKKVSTNAFAADDVRDETERSYELLHNITQLDFTYYQRDGNTWKKNKTWDNEKPEFRNIYPDVIEVKITVKDNQRNFFEGNFKFRPEMPFEDVPATY